MRSNAKVWLVPIAALTGVPFYACTADNAAPPVITPMGLDAAAPMPSATTPADTPDAAPDGGADAETEAEAAPVDSAVPVATVHVVDSARASQAGADVLFIDPAGTVTHMTTGADGLASAPVAAGSTVTVAHLVGTPRVHVQSVVSVLGVSPGDAIEVGAATVFPIGTTALHATGTVVGGPPIDTEAGLTLGGYTFETNDALPNNSGSSVRFDYAYPSDTLDSHGNATVLAAAIDPHSTPFSWAVKTISPGSAGDGGAVQADILMKDWAPPAMTGTAAVTGTPPTFATLYTLSVGFPLGDTLFASVQGQGAPGTPSALPFVAPPAPLGSQIYANVAWFGQLTQGSATVGRVHAGAPAPTISLDLADVPPKISSPTVTGTDAPTVTWQADSALPVSGVGLITLRHYPRRDAGIVDPIQWTLAFPSGGATTQAFPSMAGITGYEVGAGGWQVASVLLATSQQLDPAVLRRHPDMAVTDNAFPGIAAGVSAFDAKYTLYTAPPPALELPPGK